MKRVNYQNTITVTSITPINVNFRGRTLDNNSLTFVNDTTVYFYMFSIIPTIVSYILDNNGNVLTLVLNPNGGTVGAGSSMWANITKDTDSNGVLDYIDPNASGSVAQLLKPFSPKSDLFSLLLDSDNNNYNTSSQFQFSVRDT